MKRKFKVRVQREQQEHTDLVVESCDYHYAALAATKLASQKDESWWVKEFAEYSVYSIEEMTDET